MECKINVEECPLKTESITTKQDQNTAVIHLTGNQCSGREVGLHINTTLSIEWFKKARFLFVVNFVLSAACLLATCCIVLYYCNEMFSLRNQLHLMREHVLQSAGAGGPAAQGLRWLPPPHDLPPQPQPQLSPKKYYVEDLERDLHFTNSKNRNNDDDKHVSSSESQQGPMVAHFVGGGLERNLGDESYVGPWKPDYNSSSRDLSSHVQLIDNKLVKVHEPGLYLLYAQLVYVTSSPNCFTLWAQGGAEGAGGEPPRLLSTCASGDVSSPRSVRNAQISCAVQTVARLRAGDLLNFSQREKNSTVDLRPGASYFGLIKLSS